MVVQLAYRRSEWSNLLTDAQSDGSHVMTRWYTLTLSKYSHAAQPNHSLIPIAISNFSYQLSLRTRVLGYTRTGRIIHFYYGWFGVLPDEVFLKRPHGFAILHYLALCTIKQIQTCHLATTHGYLTTHTKPHTLKHITYLPSYIPKHKSVAS